MYSTGRQETRDKSDERQLCQMSSRRIMSRLTYHEAKKVKVEREKTERALKKFFFKTDQTTKRPNSIEEDIADQKGVTNRNC